MLGIINRSLIYTKRLTVNLVTYSVGHKVTRHIDMVDGGRYYKLNFMLIKPIEGGNFQSDKVIFSVFNRVIFFRPDLYAHSVSTITEGKRVLLSFAFHLP